MAALKIAFEPPQSRAQRCPSKGRPIDLVHLARQTCGDKNLEDEVLCLFTRQARQCLDALQRSDAPARPPVAHTLKGAARGVGAFAVASAAEHLETHPDDEAGLAALSHAVAEAQDFICGLSR